MSSRSTQNTWNTELYCSVGANFISHNWPRLVVFGKNVYLSKKQLILLKMMLHKIGPSKNYYISLSYTTGHGVSNDTKYSVVYASHLSMMGTKIWRVISERAIFMGITLGRPWWPYQMETFSAVLQQSPYGRPSFILSSCNEFLCGMWHVDFCDWCVMWGYLSFSYRKQASANPSMRHTVPEQLTISWPRHAIVLRVQIRVICLTLLSRRVWCITTPRIPFHAGQESKYLLHSCSWWRHQMETFSALLAICAGNSPVPGEFPTQKPVTRSFDVFFDLCPNERLRKQSRGWWFETLSWPL